MNLKNLYRHNLFVVKNIGNNDVEGIKYLVKVKLYL